LAPINAARLATGSTTPRCCEPHDSGSPFVGPEGASSAALAAAEVVRASITAALDLLLDPVTLASTLRP
jgi:hypothetical protein